MAWMTVEEVTKGWAPPLVPVYYLADFACDTSELQPGHRYVLFLKTSILGYRLSWYQYSIQEVPPDDLAPPPATQP